MLHPSEDEFLRLAAEGRPIPVYSETLGDVETPLSAYWKLSQGESTSFLLESVTGGEQVARYSFLGVRPRAVARSKGDEVRISGEPPRKLKPGEDPLHELARLLGPTAQRSSGMPFFVGGAVGMLAYDLVRHFEKLPDTTADDLGLDDMAMMIVDTVVVFDHAKNLIRAIHVAEPSAEGYAKARQEIDRVLARLKEPLPALPSGSFPVHPVHSNLRQEEFEAAVRKIQDYIAAGDGIQMVPSQRFSTRVDAHPVTVYRALRSLNPSPYMFLLRFDDFDLVGASPELLVSLHGDRARVRPIAGTRARGATPQEDAALAEDLLADQKEIAEHIMLVDLGRNDLGRVCQYGSVNVNELMVVERYSHVMHIVSDVTGTLEPGKDAFDLFRACHPAGTVSGAPKIRAMQIIDEVEPTRRGSYAGAVGFFSRTGDLDTSIAIRTILIKDGMGHVQAGAGIVADSVPESEYIETRNKARAALRAIELAQQGL